MGFYKLLIAYGGGTDTGYGKPELSVPIDVSRIDEYRIRFYACDDGYHVGGRMIDPDGNDIGEL